MHILAIALICKVNQEHGPVVKFATRSALLIIAPVFGMLPHRGPPRMIRSYNHRGFTGRWRCVDLAHEHTQCVVSQNQIVEIVSPGPEHASMSRA
jgi:hypothetical protein